MSAVLAIETSALTLNDINQADRVRFVAALGSVFEHSPWVATNAWAERPFASIDHLHRTMMGVVRAASREVRIDFRPAGVVCTIDAPLEAIRDEGRTEGSRG